MSNIDELLTKALSPDENMSEELKAGIIHRISEGKGQKMNQVMKFREKRRHFPAVAAIAAAVLMLSSATAFAAWNYLSAKDVAEKSGDGRLASTFVDENLWKSGEVQSYGGYDISLIGLVSGKEISDYLVTSNGEVIDDGTYAVTAIKRSDGTPMPDTSSDDYGKETFLISPYIEGYDPAFYNIFTFGGGGSSAFVENGIEYRIMHTRNVEAFADHTIYLGVTDGTFYNGEAFDYDVRTGKITRNESYTGVNALFTLPIDPAKADAKKAAELIRQVENSSAEEESEEDGMPDDVKEFMSKVTSQNIANYAEPVESTRQTVIPNEKGEYSYSYELLDGAAGGGTVLIEFMFPDGKTGMSENIMYSSSEEGLQDLRIETHTLNEDGTVTFVVYVPKKQ